MIKGISRLVALAALLVAAPALAQIKFAFDVPGSNQVMSGISLFSGWVCNVNQVTVKVDGQEELVTAYGTTRNDTIGDCGDANNGFSLLWNFNLFGTGTHVAELRADGQLIATRSFSVVRLVANGEFVTGLSGSYVIPNFPGATQALGLQWNQAAQNFSITPSNFSDPTPGPDLRCHPQDIGCIENPGNGAKIGGITAFTGWVCNASEVSFTIDGGVPIEASYGTPRADTAGACGDSNNGVGLLFNTNILGTGIHTVVMNADNTVIGSTTFQVTTLAPLPQGEFLTGLSKVSRLPGFPNSSMDTQVTWFQGLQNFAITATQNTTGPTPTPGVLPTPTPTGGVVPTPTKTPAPGVTPTKTPAPTPTKTPAGPTPTPVDNCEVPTPTPTPQGVCGNGVIDPGEECDGSDLDGQTCTSAYSTNVGSPCFGALACTSACKLDGSSCLCSCEGDDDCSFPQVPSGEFTEMQCSGFFCQCPCDPNDTGCIDAICDQCDENDEDLEACGACFECSEGTACVDQRDCEEFDVDCILAGACSGGFCVTDATPDENICLGFDPGFEESRCFF